MNADGKLLYKHHPRLRCILTPQEIEDRGLASAKLVMEIDELELAKKTAAKKAGDEIADAKDELSKLAEQVANGEEMRDVEVEARAMYSTGMVEFIRIDTGDIYEKRQLTDRERQGQLFDSPAPEGQESQDDDIPFT